MGLDQYAYRVKKENVIDNLNFKAGEWEPGHPDKFGNDLDFDYWRKFHSLDDWMLDLYRSKGGKEEFNCRYIRVAKEDLDKLKKDMEKADFYSSDVEYFGMRAEEIKEEQLEHMLSFIDKAKNAIDAGDAVYYSNWW